MTSPDIDVSPWAGVRAAWPGFEFFFEPGCTPEQFAAAEQRLGVMFSDRVGDLMASCSGAGFPSPESAGSLAAEICLSPITTWCAVPQEVIELDVLGEWSGKEKEVILIGDNPWGADYTVLALLHAPTDQVSSLMLNTAELTLQGSFEDWIRKVRPGGGKGPAAVYSAEFGEPEEIAERHRFYLNIGSFLGRRKERLERWDQFEPQFLAAVRGIRV